MLLNPTGYARKQKVVCVMNRCCAFFLGLIIILAVVIGVIGLEYTLPLPGNHAFAANPASFAFSILPSSRSGVVGTESTAFLTVINTGSSQASNVRLELATAIPALLDFQATDPMTNGPIGSLNAPVTIQPGGSQSFIIGLTASLAITPTDVAFKIVGSTGSVTSVFLGVDTLLFSASDDVATPDIVALVATPNSDGTVGVPGVNGMAVFAVATVNLGANGVITASPDKGILPLTVSICETNPMTGVCLAPPSSQGVTTQINGGGTPTFGVFVTGMGVVPFAPGTNRIFVRFMDTGGMTRGATSVAVLTQ